MTKVLSVMFYMVLDIALFVTLLFSAVQIVVYNDSYFEWHYQEHGVEESTKMDLANLMKVTDNMMDYLIDTRDTLDMTAIIDGKEEEVFGEREKAHMVDVKHLFLMGKGMRDISGSVILALVIVLVALKKSLIFRWFRQLKYFFISSFIVVIAFGGIISTDFNHYFTVFHEIFFSNDLWLLDPETDILINMVPEIFFFQTVLLILITFVIGIIITILLGNLLAKKFEIKRV
jgi:integral membrane protein (TIGR01906 family)